MERRPKLRESYCHRGGDEPLLGATIPGHFAEIVARFGDREAVVSLPQGRRLTYGELSREVDRVARGLIGLGFAAGDRIGVWSTDNIEWLLVQMATARVGAVLVNINPAYRPRELAYVLERAEIDGLFLIPAFRSSDYVAMVTEVVPELARAEAGDGALAAEGFPHLKRVVVYDPAAPAETVRPEGSPGVMTWVEVLAAGDGVDTEALEAATRALDRDEAINIQFTSGTTGFPKAVVLTHHNILNNAYFSAQALGFTEADRLCVPVPFYHCFGMVLANLLCLSVGAALVIPSEHFDAPAVLHAIEAERCTAVHGVPTMFIAELEHPDFAGFDLTSLRTGIMAGAPCPEPLMRRVMEDMHCPEILIGYGETEASPLTHLTDRGDSIERRTQTVGRNLPHQEVKVVEVESRRTLACGEIGEICFRGHHIMRGYYNDAEATAKAVDAAGWLASGDLGTMDEDGYVRITGRLKEMIIRGGENIYPREIEDWLFAHPKISQAAVFGVPDEFYGEEICAWVELHPGETMSEDELREYCGEGLAHFMVPKYLRFVTEFPMTVTGKLQKFRMRESEIETLGLHADAG
ncbi:MAG: AMP-binding protein [Alphaproteobacteria bacterium]|nr:AMP-binding protein [Alphaproteobacteria bacterium]